MPGIIVFPLSRKFIMSSIKSGTADGSKFSTVSALKGTQSLPKKIYFKIRKY